MNKIKKTILMPLSLLVIIIGIVGACSDSFLEINPQAKLNQESLKSQAGVEAALIGTYALLDGYHIDNNNTWPSDPVNWIMGSVPTDDAYKGSEQGDLGEATLLELYQWQPGNSLLNQKYVPQYEGVSRANTVINLANETEGLDAAVKDRVMGEALFLRAHFHFELYKPFGRIVYMNENDTKDPKNLNFFKANEDNPDDVLALIAADLENAVTLLPASQSDLGRVNKVAAQAFLGKVYMYARDYAKAKTNLDAVVASGRTLANCQRDLFTYSTENHPEALFSVQMSLSNAAQARNSNWLNQLANPNGGGFGCCGFHQPSQNLVNAFKVDASGLPMLDTFNITDLNPLTDKVDPRLDFTVGRDGAPYWDWTVHFAGMIRSRSYSGPYSPKKMQPYTTSPIVAGGWNGAANNGVNIPVIRLADVYLLLAEAEVEIGTLARAEELVNLVRARAGNCAQGPWIQVPDGPDTGTAPDKVYVGAEVIVPGAKMNDALNSVGNAGNTWATYDVKQYPVGTFATKGAVYAKKAVRFERRLELAMEGNRLFDIRRWDDMEPGYAATVLNAFVAHESTKGATAAVQASYYTEAEAFALKHRWYPLPTAQVELATVNGVQILTQNPGY